MADPQAVETPATPPRDHHYETVSRGVPQWLLQAPAEQRQALRTSVPQALPWLAEAARRLPDVLQAWHDEARRHEQYRDTVQRLLARLPSAEEHAAPLLHDALKQRFGLELDVRRTFLFNAVRARVAEAHLSQVDPAVRAFQAVRAGTASLLQAALQNFEAFEAQPDGLRDGRRMSTLFTSASGQPMDPGESVELVPERFAALCRELDFGAGYQRLIDALFVPLPQNAKEERQAWFKLFEQSTLRLNLHLARLRGWLDQGQYAALLEEAKNGKARGDVERAGLTLWDIELNGIVLFFHAGAAKGEPRLLVYMPDEPRQSLQAFDSLQAFQASLRERLRDEAWRRYFLRFVPARERDGLVRRIRQALYPKVWNPGGWYEERYDANASLPLGKRDFSAPLFNGLLQRKIAVLKDDGLFHAVPTAEQDHKSARDKVDYFLGVAFNVANVAAFVVPGLGQVMLAVNAALLGYEVYEGFDSLSRGEKEQAWGYFMDVGENLALMAALGVVGAAAGRFEGNLPLAVRGMRPVTLADGRVRLWKPDITPFAYDIRLPDGLQPGENGLYHYQGRDWLALEGRYYSVRELLGSEPGYVLEHPQRPEAYEPVVRPNGNGGWLHEADAPGQWQGLDLFRRQGPLEAGVSAAMAERALRISGIGEAQLRHALVTCQRPPALLSETLQRLVLAGEGSGAAFEARYRAGQPALSAAGRLLQEQFDLPHRLVEEIVAAANPRELGEMALSGRAPPHLAEEARLYQQQVRIARACEGLYLDLEANVDSARLMLHGLETLAQWPKNQRVGLYAGSPAGPLLTAIGSGAQAEIAVAWHGQSPGAFCQALFDALPEAVRSQLGVDAALALRERLQAQPPVSREQLREWLGMPSRAVGFRSPMRLADGRIGYPLSGKPQPFFTEDELLDKLRLLELDDLPVEDALGTLQRRGLDRVAISARLDGLLGEMLELRQRLDRWALETAHERLSEGRQGSRERIGCALWDHWRRSVLVELGRPAPRLILWQVQLADLPGDLPAFFRERVRELLLDDVVQREGDAYARMLGEVEVEALARQFPNLTSLDIRGGEWAGGVAQTIAGLWPRLMSLGLRELDVQIGHRDLRALAALPRLRRLSLRGSRLREMPSTTLHGLTLDYLGLDWLDLQEWPVWLDNTALLRIGELSLVGNQLSEVPPLILADATPVARPLRIAIHANQLGHHSLLDLLLAERFHRRFTFDLDLAPGLAELLNRQVTERASLQSALQAWADPAVATEPLAPEHLAYRQRLTRVLLGYWREDLRSPGLALLGLDDVVLADFPEHLPPFFAERVRRLDLTRFHAGPEADSLERFLGRFPQLRELSLISGQPALARVPECLTGFAHLRELALVRMGMTIDQAAMEVFGRMPVLSSLQLDGNALGAISDVSMFANRFLGFLGLSEMNIATWPAWLDHLLPTGIELLGLDDNQLSELPPQVLANRRVTEGAVEISLRNNPLDRETLIAAHTSQHEGRPYSFTLDLPDDIAEMAYQEHESDSEDDSVEDPAQSDDDPASTWETGDVAQDERNQFTWLSLVTAGDAQALLGLVGRLRYSADYRTPATREELVQRVWRVLVAAAQDSELRQTLNGIAQEPLEQINSHETCPDGIRLEFNQMEGLVHTRQALSGITDADRGPALFRLMRGLFRSQSLDQIAREHANGRDEAEVRLAYRLRWAAELQLPVPPRAMLYRGAANIAPGELNLVLTLQQLREAGPAMLAFASKCDFWVAYLREVNAERFKVLKDTYEAQVRRATDVYPDESLEQSSARIAALEAKYREDEQTLLEQLTLQHSLAS